MNSYRSAEYLVGLVNELRRLPHETEWVEFKHDNSKPQEIGEYISALSNAAALIGKAFAYLVWGIDDTTHDVIGSNFKPSGARLGNEELESWLLIHLVPKINFVFYEVEIDKRAVILMEVERANHQPTKFDGAEFIRIGSYKKPLQNYPQKERALWRIFDQTVFEEGIAIDRVEADEVLHLLDYPAYFDLLEQPLPENREGILKALVVDDMIRACDAGGWDITNLGAILFAKKLQDFARLTRKAMRVIQYRGTSRVETLKEQVGGKGYASGFEGLIGFINGLLPSNEVIGQALRNTVPMFPELAVRELVANALIHQDFSASGTGPMVEIFDDRIEITNPGEPLVDTNRFIDTPPKSRNEKLASVMRRFRICEERGSGIDKVIFQIEYYQLPAPLFEVPPGFTRVLLFAHKPLTEMAKTDRERACYLHACLKYVSRSFLTNTTLRERFGIEEKNSAIASRLIKEAVGTGLITPYDPETSKKMMKYIPYWAKVEKAGDKAKNNEIPI